MKAEIISVGTELLMGEIVDTNANFLATQLPLLGIELCWISTAGDVQKNLVEVLQRALQRSDLILVTGGLGPTGDDLTRESIAEAVGETMIIDDRLVEEMRCFFAGRHLNMPESNLKQAALIPSATAIPNPRGTAPGWWVEKNKSIIVSMPGPPREMTGMWTDYVFPRLQKISSEVIKTLTIKTFGLGEAAVGDLVKPLFAWTNPVLGIYAKNDGIWLRLIATGKNGSEAEALIQHGLLHIKPALNELIWGYDNETMEEVLGAILRERKLTIATMESLTGGLLASSLTDVPGSSDYFTGGLVTYANDAKILQGVPAETVNRFGVVSAETAEAMAQSVRRQFKTDIGVSTTGVAGPAELEHKTAGTAFIGISFGDRTFSVKRNFPGNRMQIKHRVIYTALFELRKILFA